MGFTFIQRDHFSKSYQWHSTIGLEYTYPILQAIQKAIELKVRALPLEIRGGLGVERILIWKGSLKKAKKQMFEMIKKIQQ